MERTIKLIMQKDKQLKIYVDGVEKYTILETDRNITADKIYELVGFSIGDHYSVTEECQENTDKPVLDFFAELFNSIINKVNQLSENDSIKQ